MEKKELIARIATQVIVQQLEHGAKHPSPGLIKEAVDTAHGIVEELAKQFDARDAAEKAAELARAGEAAAAALAAAAEAAAVKPPAGSPVTP